MIARRFELNSTAADASRRCDGQVFPLLPLTSRRLLAAHLGCHHPNLHRPPAREDAPNTKFAYSNSFVASCTICFRLWALFDHILLSRILRLPSLRSCASLFLLHNSAQLFPNSQTGPFISRARLLTSRLLASAMAFTTHNASNRDCDDRINHPNIPAGQVCSAISSAPRDLGKWIWQACRPAVSPYHAAGHRICGV